MSYQSERNRQRRAILNRPELAGRTLSQIWDAPLHWPDNYDKHIPKTWLTLADCIVFGFGGGCH